jgi:predicted S18 family serine protease
MTVTLAFGCLLNLSVAAPTSTASMERTQVINFLGVSVPRDARDFGRGAVGQMVVGWEQRNDHHGITVSFLRGKGSFSSGTEVAILLAIDRAARTAGLRTDNWSVTFRVQEPAGTIYGDSLSGLAGLTVIALAKGDFIPSDRTMTGTITQDGGIGPVSSIPLKIEAASEKHFRRVIIPEEIDVTDSDWVNPFLMQVSPIQSATLAYQALTGHSMKQTYK